MRVRVTVRAEVLAPSEVPDHQSGRTVVHMTWRAVSLEDRPLRTDWDPVGPNLFAFSASGDRGKRFTVHPGSHGGSGCERLPEGTRWRPGKPQQACFGATLPRGAGLDHLVFFSYAGADEYARVHIDVP